MPPGPSGHSHWPLVLDEVFSAPTWNLVLSQSRPKCSGPMVRFTPTFLRWCLFPALAVLLLSMSQIRRSLVPLDELQEGTRAIAQRDFGSRVAGDRAGTSSRSWARHSTPWPRSSTASSRRSRPPRRSTGRCSRPPTSRDIVETLTARLRDVCPCDMVSVTLVAPDGTKSLPGVLQDYVDEGNVEQLRVDLRSGDVQDLLEGPGGAHAERVGAAVALVPVADERPGCDDRLRASAPLPAPAHRHHRPRKPRRHRRRRRSIGFRRAASPTRPPWR